MDTKQRKQPVLTCDAIVVREHESGKQILLITRGHPPFLGKLAFPGGHLDYGENPQQCVLRELREETGVEGNQEVELLTVKGAPDRDPRGHHVTIVYKVSVSPTTVPQAGDDAATADWYNLNDQLNKTNNDFAFDHFSVLQEVAHKL